MKWLFYFFMGLLLITAGCREAYESPVVSPVTGYLVVEGVIGTTGTASIKLSRTTKLEVKGIVYETGATVRLEGENNSTYTLTDRTSGLYSIDNLNLNPAVRYRLRIRVKTGKEYLSDYAAVKNNPAIDSISWNRDPAGVHLFVNTHDPQNNTRYYQWAYDETWQIQSSYLAVLKYKIVSGSRGPVYSVVYKDSTTYSYDPSIINCWQFNSSNQILIGSTAKLTKDVVNLPLTLVQSGNIKIGVLYSINVKQYAWTKEGYEFLDKMKKNTESTGSIFDAQPSELKGNIHCVTDTTEPVVGFFNICPVQEKRIFISASQVPNWGYSQGCFLQEIKNISDTIVAQGLALAPATTGETSPFSGAIVTFFAAPPECVDCTLRGTNKKPAYWP